MGVATNQEVLMQPGSDAQNSRVFRRWCTHCKQQVPTERLIRGSDTCSAECKRKDRIAQRRFQKKLALERVLRDPRTRRLAAGFEIEQKAEAQCATAHAHEHESTGHYEKGR